MKFNEVLEAKIYKSSSDDQSRVVVAGVLQGDFTSENKRFYPMHVVKEAANSLVGKASMVGHETNSPRDVVARITGARMVENRLIADFKFGTDPTSNEMFMKVKEGLVDSYSIRAWGESKPGKVNGEEVEIVQTLEIATVDLVVEGGIKSAKVLRVYENAPKVEQKEEVKMDEKELQAKIAEAVAKAVEENNKARDVQETDKLKLANEKAALDNHKLERLSTVKDESNKEYIKAGATQATIAEFDAYFDRTVKHLAKVVKEDVVIKAHGSKDESKDVKDPIDFLESSEISYEDKKEALKIIFG